MEGEYHLPFGEERYAFKDLVMGVWCMYGCVGSSQIEPERASFSEKLFHLPNI